MNMRQSLVAEHSGNSWQDLACHGPVSTPQKEAIDIMERTYDSEMHLSRLTTSGSFVKRIVDLEEELSSYHPSHPNHYETVHHSHESTGATKTECGFDRGQRHQEQFEFCIISVKEEAAQILPWTF